jgi:hypothetical protein
MLFPIFICVLSCSVLTRCMASTDLEPGPEGAGRGGQDAPAAYYFDRVPQYFPSGKVNIPLIPIRSGPEIFDS